jgi:hypothetical protein
MNMYDNTLETGPWFPFRSQAHMDFVCWFISGSPIAREKTDVLHGFLKRYLKREVVGTFPTSYKTQNAWQDANLPVLPLTPHKIKV